MKHRVTTWLYYIKVSCFIRMSTGAGAISQLPLSSQAKEQSKAEAEDLISKLEKVVSEVGKIQWWWGLQVVTFSLFQTNAEQQTKIQDLQEKLSKVECFCLGESWIIYISFQMQQMLPPFILSDDYMKTLSDPLVSRHGLSTVKLPCKTRVAA